jgi:2-polyprenyl-3-methyl-5-hydroxy-6-metoxy-1,4-benzoquinol methylase
MENCILCNINNFSTIFKAKSPDFDETFKIERCLNCGLIRSEPQSDLSKYYIKSNYFAKENSPFNIIKKNLANLLKISPIEKFKSHGKILDVGCGDGQFLSYLNKNKWDLYGIEPYGYSKTSNNEIKITKGTFEKTNLQNNFFDLITFWHVLEHVDNPILVLKESKRILKEDGLLFISIPNSKSLGFKIFKNKWFGLYPPIHIHHFNIETINQILEKSGFKIIHIQKFTWEYAPFVLLQSVLNNLGFIPINYFYKMLRGNNNNLIFNIINILFAVLSIPIVIILLAFEMIDDNGSEVINIYAKHSES